MATVTLPNMPWRNEVPSLRDQFVMAALQGLLAGGDHRERRDTIYDAFQYAAVAMEMREAILQSDHCSEGS